MRSRPGLLPLVGRDGELAQLRSAWAAARSGHGGLAVVHGDPGIGKTRLVTQLADAAVDDGGIVAAGGAPDLAGPALGLWVEACTALVRRLDPLPDAPWVAALAPMLPAHIKSAPGETPPDLTQARLAEAVVELVRASTERAPVLLVLEDLHAADEASLTLLAYVARRLSSLRVLLVATRRQRPLPDQLAALEQAARSAGTTRTDIALGPLDGARHLDARPRGRRRRRRRGRAGGHAPRTATRCSRSRRPARSPPARRCRSGCAERCAPPSPGWARTPASCSGRSRSPAGTWP